MVGTADREGCPIYTHCREYKHCSAELYSLVLVSSQIAWCTTVYLEPEFTRYEQNQLFRMNHTLPTQKVKFLEARFAQH